MEYMINETFDGQMLPQGLNNQPMQNVTILDGL